MNKDKQEKGSYTNMKPHELRNYTCVVKTDSDEIHCTRNKPMKTYKQKVLEEFDERFKMAGTYPMGVFQGNKVKQFIEKTLQEQREEDIEEIKRFTLMKHLDQEEMSEIRAYLYGMLHRPKTPSLNN